MMLPLRHQVSCDLSRPISSMQRVWDVMARHLRQVREAVRETEDELYGRADRMGYVTACHEALRYVTDRGAGVKLHSVTSLADLEKVLDGAREIASPRSPRQLQSTVKDLMTYLDRLKSVADKLQHAKAILTEDLLRYLEMYCTNYVKLGNTDDKFFKGLRLRTVSIHDHVKAFEQLMEVLTKDSKLSEKYFCDGYFSQEIAIVCDCHTFPLLRIVPDLIQKIELSCDTASDWLRSDKVYVEAVQNEIENTRSRVNDSEHNLKLFQLEYDSTFKTLKDRQAESDYFDGNVDTLWKEVSKMEAKKARLDMQISAVEKSLSGCKENLRGLDTTERHCYWSDSDEPDGYCGQAHSSYKTRLNKDAEAHSAKLSTLMKKKQKLDKQISKKRAVLEEAQNKEIEVQKLRKRLRAIGKQKSKLSEEIDIESTHLQELQEVLKRRLNPRTAANRTTTASKTVASAKREISSYAKQARLSLLPKREKLQTLPIDLKGEKREKTNKENKPKAKTKPRRSAGEC